MCGERWREELNRSAPEHLLVVAVDEVSSGVAERLCGAFPDCRFELLDFLNGPKTDLPAAWCRLSSLSLVDDRAMARDIGAWFDEWPERPLHGGWNFAAMFTVQGQFCPWWFGPASSRDPTKGRLLPGMCMVWLLARALDQVAPDSVHFQISNPRIHAVLSSLCHRRGIRIVDLEGCDRQVTNRTFRGCWRWLLGALLLAFLLPMSRCMAALIARLSLGNPTASKSPRAKPTLVLGAEYPRHVTSETSGARDSRIWYWQEFADFVSQQAAPFQIKYLLFTRKHNLPGRWRLLKPLYTGWSQLRGVADMAPIEQAYACLGDYVRQLPGHLAALCRYARWEATRTFRESFDFHGADIAPLVVPALRSCVAKMLKWSLSVRATERSLAGLGNVRAVLVHDEFLPHGVKTIAAARNLGIPTVGVQHGLISNMMLVSSGHHRNGLAPDYFAAYGEVVREAMQVYGNFPAERTWITGSPRFDRLPTRPRPVDAIRARLNIPKSAFVVLFTTGTFDWTRNAFAMLLRATLSMPDAWICLKTHGGDERSVERYLNIAKDIGHPRVQIFTDHFESLLMACDALFNNTCSTTMLEAMLCDKPAVYMQVLEEPVIFPMTYPFAAPGGALQVDTEQDLQRAIERLIDRKSENQTSYAQPYLDRHVGPSAAGLSSHTLYQRITETFFQSEVSTGVASELQRKAA